MSIKHSISHYSEMYWFMTNSKLLWCLFHTVFIDQLSIHSERNTCSWDWSKCISPSSMWDWFVPTLSHGDFLGLPQVLWQGLVNLERLLTRHFEHIPVLGHLLRQHHCQHNTETHAQTVSHVNACKIDSIFKKKQVLPFLSFFPSHILKKIYT